MDYKVYLDGNVVAEPASLPKAEEFARNLAVANSPKMVSVRDSGQKKGDPARRTYAVKDGVLRWTALGDSRIEVKEEKV
jgi:hypothetical protein